VNNIITTNKYITHHQGIGAIFDAIINLITFCCKGYRTDTKQVIDDSLSMVEQQFRPLMR
jgi:hypothetical protein